MEKKQIDEMLQMEEYAKLAELLEMEEYEEYAMVTLYKVYLKLGEEKKARKLLRKIKMLFPAAEYQESYDTVKATSFETSISQSQMRKGPIPQSIAECFQAVVGLESVQVELDKFYKLLLFQKDRKQNQFRGELLESTHFAIVGKPGSGKTMVGEIIGKLLYDFNVRLDEQVVSIDSKSLLDAFNVGDEIELENLFANYHNVTILIENIDPSVMPYEDAYVARFATGIKKVLWKRKSELSIIITGSQEAMDKILNVCPTMEDALYEIIHIPEYSTLELLEIARKLARAKSLLINKDAERVLLKKIDIERNRIDFMNAITLHRYIEHATVKMAERYFLNNDDSEEAMVYLMPEDFENEMENESIESLIEQLESLTGLRTVKAQVRKRIESVSVTMAAERAGVARKGGQGSLHMLFTGNPGTGKTTVARIIGKMYQQLGILPRGNHLVECSRSDLVAEYVGQTAPKVQKKVKEAVGGVLFIDEAYALCRDEHDNFGHEAVDELIKQIEDNRENMLVILAGYKKEMAEFLKTNPGFSSRIRNEIVFEDYTTEEMVEIFCGMAKKYGMCLEKGTSEVLLQMMETMSKESDFGNARGVRNLFEDIMDGINSRIYKMQNTGVQVASTDYCKITQEDIERVMGQKARAKRSIDELLDDLHALTGLSGVKRKVQEMVDDMEVKSYQMSQSKDFNAGYGTLHLVFKGNAGTGKTTVARIIGQIYKELGILSKNVFVEVGRSDLVASYLGQTAKLVKKKIDEAEGGILFIDEAYTLNQGESDHFGHEAINTLVAELENRRDKLMVILAGYSDEMERFLSVNQGLASRLANEIVFEDYTDEELVKIFKYQAKQRGLLLSGSLDGIILEQIRKEKIAVKDFGNARGVRNIVEKTEKRKNSRIAPLLREGRTLTEEFLRTVEAEDFS